MTLFILTKVSLSALLCAVLQVDKEFLQNFFQLILAVVHDLETLAIDGATDHGGQCCGRHIRQNKQLIKQTCERKSAYCGPTTAGTNTEPSSSCPRPGPARNPRPATAVSPRLRSLPQRSEVSAPSHLKLTWSGLTIRFLQPRHVPVMDDPVLQRRRLSCPNAALCQWCFCLLFLCQTQNENKYIYAHKYSKQDVL